MDASSVEGLQVVDPVPGGVVVAWAVAAAAGDVVVAADRGQASDQDSHRRVHPLDAGVGGLDHRRVHRGAGNLVAPETADVLLVPQLDAGWQVPGQVRMLLPE